MTLVHPAQLAWVAAVAMAMAIVVWACGGSSDPPRSDSTGTVETPPTGRTLQSDTGDPRGVGNRGAIKEVLNDVQADFPSQMGSNVCGELTSAGRRELAAIRLDGVGRDCQDVAAELARRMDDAEVPPRYSRVISVTFADGVATALVRDPGRPPYRVPFAKRPGQRWKLVSLEFAEPIAAVLER